MEALPLPEPVKQQIVAERLQIVRKAAKADRIAQPDLPKKNAGPRVRKITQERAVIWRLNRRSRGGKSPRR